MALTRSAMLVAAALALAVPTGLAEASPPAPATRSATSAAATAQVLASGLSIPWGIAALPDGSALVTERNTGRIWQVKPRSAAKVVYTVTETRPAGEGGLLGIALAPDFSRSRAFFVYYTTAVDNRVARIVLGSPARPIPIVTGIPKGSIHNGGGLAFKGSSLLIGTGDTGNRDLAQNTKSLGGKVLRVTTTGAPVRGNGWGRVLSIGHRNVQDITVDPQGIRVWATELGQDTQDELNHLMPAANFGWPICEGRCSHAGFRNPAWTWSPAEASPSGITWVHTKSGDRFYVGALRGQRVWKFTVSPSTGAVSGMTPVLVNSYGRIRGVQGRGDGSLWIMTSNGSGTDRVIRISPAP
jgi:glucose/arabinose dehydrogenase